MVGLVMAGSVGPTWPLVANVFLLGVANGIYAGAAIGSMMVLATTGSSGREGTRMGVWGAAQAVAFGIGGFAGTVAVDAARWLSGSPIMAYATVFAAEAVLFIASAALALAVARLDRATAVPRKDLMADDDVLAMAAGR